MQGLSEKPSASLTSKNLKCDSSQLGVATLRQPGRHGPKSLGALTEIRNLIANLDGHIQKGSLLPEKSELGFGIKNKLPI